MSQACVQVRVLIESQMKELSATKNELHAKLMLYMKNESELRQIALQYQTLNKRLRLLDEELKAHS